MSDRPFDRFDKTACNFPSYYFFIKVFVVVIVINMLWNVRYRYFRNVILVSSHLLTHQWTWIECLYLSRIQTVLEYWFHKFIFMKTICKSNDSATYLSSYMAVMIYRTLSENITYRWRSTARNSESPLIWQEQ